jgi:hypothetical protein
MKKIIEDDDDDERMIKARAREKTKYFCTRITPIK